MSNPTNEQELRERIEQCFTSNVEESSESIELFDTDRVIADIATFITAHTNAEIAKVLKTILKSYPKKNRTMNDTSKLTRADIDRMITELKEVK